VLKAAVRSKIIKIALEEDSFSAVHNSKAGLKSYFSIFSELFCAMKDRNWEETTFSITFDKNGHLEIVQK
jgi:hypothetical protein